MKRIAATAATLAILALAGCSALSSEPSGGAVPEAPTVDPGPVELSVEEAGERYLNIVCPNNIAVDVIDAAYRAGEAEHLSGGSPDPAAVTAAAATLVELNRSAVEHLDDEYFTWPGGVVNQIRHIRALYMGDLTMNQAVMNAATFAEAYNTPFPDSTPEQDAAGQEIRYQLDLDSDTVGSCVGREDGLTTLDSERAVRETALASQQD